ncbi:MAG TPA: response regulator transcription factor [Terriglobales bacterium]|nr:response regulator transcription factor [Terriglobales bacterium]
MAGAHGLGESASRGCDATVSSDSIHIFTFLILFSGAIPCGRTFSQGHRAVSAAGGRFRSSRGRKGAFVIATVLLADDNPVIVNHVRKLLGRNQQYDVVGAVSDGDAVLREYFRLRPDVIVLDISMGELSGIDVARTLVDSGCTARIVFLTVHEDSDFLNAAMDAGGSAYVVKSRVSTDLTTAIEAALSGKHFVSSCLAYDPL